MELFIEDSLKLDKNEIAICFKFLSKERQLSIVDNYLKSIVFNNGTYIGSCGVCFSGDFKHGYDEAFFVSQAKNVIESLGYDVLFKKWSNFGAMGVDFKIRKKADSFWKSWFNWLM